MGRQDELEKRGGRKWATGLLPWLLAKDKSRLSTDPGQGQTGAELDPENSGRPGEEEQSTGKYQGNLSKGPLLSLHLCPELWLAWPPSAGPGFDGSTGWYEELGITHTLCRTRVTEAKPCGDR